MVKQAFSFLSRESRSVGSAAFVIGFFTLLSQLFALVRDRLLAHYVGAGTELDVYYAAFRLPDFLYVSIASLASITVLMPFLIERLGSGGGEGETRAREFFSRIFSALSLLLIIASLALFFLLPKLAPFLAPGFSSEGLALLVSTSRLLLLSPILFGMSNMLGAATQMFQNFRLFALSPVLYNIGIIMGIVFLYPILGVKGIAGGVLFGAFLHLGIQIPYLAAKKFLPQPVLRIKWGELWSVASVSLPRTAGLAVGSLTLIIFVSLVSRLGSGAISLFQFAQNLQAVPIAIIGASFSVASFPTLVRFFQKGERQNFLTAVGQSLRTVIFWTLPTIALFIVLRAHIVRVIYGTQALSWDNTRLVAALLALFVIGILAQNIVLLFTRSFYAAGRTWTPLWMNILAEATKVILAMVLLRVFIPGNPLYDFLGTLLRITDVPGRELLAFPLAYIVGSWINVLLHTLHFRKEFGIIRSAVPQELLKNILGALAMGVGAWLGLRFFDPLFSDETFWGILGQGGGAGILGIIIGSIVFALLRSKEFSQTYRIIRNKVWKTKDVIAEPQPDITT